MKRCNDDHVSVTWEIWILDWKRSFFERQHWKVSFRVTIGIDFDFRASDALESLINWEMSSRKEALTQICLVLNDGINNRGTIAGNISYHIFGQWSGFIH